MRTLHRIIGVVGIVTFLGTGVLMRRHVPAMSELDDGTRLLLRSRHIYLLLGSLVNLAAGVNYRSAAGRVCRGIQTGGSILMLIAPVLFALAFFIEPQQALLERGLARLGVFAVAIGTVLQLAGIARSARTSDAPRYIERSTH